MYNSLRKGDRNLQICWSYLWTPSNCQCFSCVMYLTLVMYIAILYMTLVCLPVFLRFYIWVFLEMQIVGEGATVLNCIKVYFGNLTPRCTLTYTWIITANVIIKNKDHFWTFWPKIVVLGHITENGANYVILTNKTPFKKLKFNSKLALLAF